MNISEIQNQVSNNLFESDFNLYKESVDLILSFFQHDKDIAYEELVDLMQEVLDNKQNTYVKGEFTDHQKSEVLNFVRYHWNVSLVKMKIEGMEQIRIDSMVSHLLDILSFIAPLNGKIKTLLEEFCLEENNEMYKTWIQLRLNSL